MRVPSLLAAARRALTPAPKCRPFPPAANDPGARPLLSAFQAGLAAAEGWCLLDLGTGLDAQPRHELRCLSGRHGARPRFSTDEQAWRHIVAQARTGSVLHLHALLLADPAERLLIRRWCGWVPDPAA